MDHHQPLAIIGMACWLPEAENLDQFWQLLIENQCAIKKVPESLLDRELYFEPQKGERGKSYIDRGGLVNYPAFDQAVCRYPTNVMGYIEVGHLLMVQTAAKACVDAGLNPFDIPLRNTGVYVGNNQAGHLSGHLTYATIVEEAAQYLKELSVYREVTGERADMIIQEVVHGIRRRLPNYGHNGFPTVGYHVTANAVSDALGLSGPSLVLDAACSSSLKALALAAHDIQLGQIDMAIVGGASFFTTDSLLLFSAAQSGSAHGSFPFSEQADGLISAEGNVAIVVKSLDRAIRDGDPIQAIIPGIGVSSDGRGKSLWAPRKEGQIKAIHRAYPQKEEMLWLDYVEAHATSTALGDQTELEAMQKAFDLFSENHEKIPVGGVKANIGHALEAAGLAGLIKSVLVLQKEMVPKQINSTPLNTKVDWDRLPFFVPQENMPLSLRKDGRARRAAVNSFGIGGLNVHVVLQEFRPQDLPQLSQNNQPKPQMQVQEPIAVVGAGGIFPGARTVAAFEQMLFSGKDATCEAEGRWNKETGFSPEPGQLWKSRARRGGFITDFDYDWKRHRIAPKQILNADPLQFLILDSVDAAIADAGYDLKQIATATTGVIVGSNFDTDFAAQLCMGFRLPHFQRELRKVLESHGIVDRQRIDQILEQYAESLIKNMPAILDETGSFTPSTLASRITKTYDFMGGAGTIDTGHSVGLAALMQAANELRTGACDVMICSVGARLMGLSIFLRMSLAGQLTADSARNPFDANYSGQVPGEGAGTLILKRLSDAQRDGDKIHCVLHGIGCGYDSQPEIAFEQAMQRAWTHTLRAKEDVLIVETSSGADVAAQELQAIQRVYGQTEFPVPVSLDRADAQFGNMLGVSGMTSLLKANLELQQLCMPGSFAYSSPVDALDGLDKHFNITADKHRLQWKKSLDGPSPLAGVSTWDPCGSTYHVIIERGNRVPLSQEDSQNNNERITSDVTTHSDSSWKIVRFSADHPAAMQDVIRQALVDPAACFEKAARSYNDCDSLPGKYQLAVVASNAEDLGKKLELARQYSTPEKGDFLSKNGVFYATPENMSGKTAFFFPGQGSQYPMMLKSLIEHFTPAKSAFEEINRDLQGLGYPAFDQFAWSENNELGKDVFKTQLSLLCADTIILRSLAALGVRPDVVVGHSFGEFAALVGAGVWSFREGAKATFLRCRAIEECRSAVGCMLSTNWGETASQRICDQVGADLFVANINAPDQTVLAGSKQSIAAAEQIIKSEKGLAKIIPVPRPFHSPLMQDVCKPLYDALGDVVTQTPEVSFFSGVSNRYETAPDQIRQNLAEQMTQPVRYIDLVRRLHQDGVTMMVECGPGQVLTSLHRKILPQENVLLLSADSKRGDGIYPLLCVRAAFETAERSKKYSAATNIVSGITSMSSVRESSQNLATWARQYRKQIVTQLRQLADRGGIALDREKTIPSILSQPDILVDAKTIACAVDVFEPAVTALIASCGGLQKFKETIEQSSVAPENAPGKSPKDQSDTPQVSVKPEQRPMVSKPVRAEAVSFAVSSSPVISESEFREFSRDDNGSPPGGLPEGHVYTRFSMRMMRKSLPRTAQKTIQWNGRALIVGQNKIALALAELIRESGGEPVLLSSSDNIESLLAEVEGLWQEKPMPHLFIVTGHDPDAMTDMSEPSWSRRREQGIYLPYFVTWKWYQLIAKNKLLAKSTLCASSVLGGDFGFSGNMRSIEGGATAGLIKSLDIEGGMPTHFAFIAKQIDFSIGENTTQDVREHAQFILAELAAAVPYETEIAYHEGKRYLVRPIAQRAVKETSSSPCLPEGNWVVTGGGRGITAFLAQELAETYPNVHLHLLGSRTAPDIDPAWHALKNDAERLVYRKQFHQSTEAAGENAMEKWRQFECALEVENTLNAMRQKGIRVTYHHCDVTDRLRLETTLQTIRQHHGPISGIMHGAGIEVSCRMELKNPEIVKKTFRIKGDAAAALIDLTRNDPIRHFIGFGSVAGRMGSIGQADYSMANETLAKICDWYQRYRPECRVICFHWGPWGQIGMAARPEMQSNPLLSTMTLLPPQEGRQHFLDELLTSERTTETLLVGWSHYKMYYPDTADVPESEEEPNGEDHDKKTESASSPESSGFTQETVELNKTPIRRFVVRMVDGSVAPVRENVVIGGVAMIIGRNRDADTLARTLQKQGVSVSQIGTLENKDQLLAELDRIWENQGPVSHLFLMTGRAPEAIDLSETDRWRKRRCAGFFAPFYLLRHWLRKIDEAKMMDRCAVVAATNMNGDFGITSGTSALESAGLAGLLKTIHLEHGGPERNGLLVRLVDFEAKASPETITSHLITELCTGGFDVEISYGNGKRRVARLFSQEVAANGPGIQQNSTWVFTGGARGITAEVAMALGSHYRLKLHLIGSSPFLPVDDSLRNLTDEGLKPYKREIVKKALAAKESPDKAWGKFRNMLEMDRNIRRMQDAGIEVHYHQCDITVAEEVARTFSEIQSQSGEIYGIVHGAGIDGNPATIKNMLDSQFEVADKLIAIKVDAVLEMLRHVNLTALEYFVGFGSISGRFGSANASSYCSGNDMLCKIMGELRREAPHCRTVGIHWHAWDNVGMMMRPVSYGSIKILKMQLMSPQKGIAHLISELDAGLPENEIVITDSQYYTLFYSPEMLADDSTPCFSVSPNPAARMLPENESRRMSKESAGPISSHPKAPMIESMKYLTGPELSVCAQCVFRPAQDPFLMDHRFRGRPLLPAVVTIESFLETVAGMFPDKTVVALHDLELFKGVMFHSDEPMKAMVTAETVGNFVECRLSAPLTNKNNTIISEEYLFSKAVVELADGKSPHEIAMPLPPEGEWHKIWYSDKSAMMYHGPQFQQLQSGLFDETQGVWGRIKAFAIDDFAPGRSTSGWQIHPATLDACLYLCGVCVWLELKGAIGLPKSLQLLRIGRMPRSSEACMTHITIKARKDSEFIFDILCCGENNELLFYAENYCCQIVPTSLGGKNAKVNSEEQNN